MDSQSESSRRRCKTLCGHVTVGASSADSRGVVQSQTIAAAEMAADNSKLQYADDYIKDILRDVRTIAMVGASPDPTRASYLVMEFMQSKGYKVVPINPKAAAEGALVLGEKVYADLDSLPVDMQVDMVDIFRSSEAAGQIADEAIAMTATRKVGVVWMQQGVINEAAAQRCLAAGLRVVMDLCPKPEYSRLEEQILAA